MLGYCNVNLIGNVTNEPKVGKTERGEYVMFGLAVNQGYGENKSVDYFDVVHFVRPGGKFATIIKKGMSAFVTGSLTMQQATEKYKAQMRVKADTVRLETPREASPSNAVSASEASLPEWARK